MLLQHVWGINLRAKALVIPTVLSILLISACRREPEVAKLAVEDGKIFTEFRFVEGWRKEYDWLKWCLPFPGGVACLELLDKSYREYRFNLYDSSGDLVKEKRVLSGDGPDELRMVNMDSVWLSSSGQIHCVDNDYIKSINPETFQVTTLTKLSNVVKGYGSKFTVGRQSGTSFEEQDGQIITTFESTGFYENLTYYLVKLDRDFQGLSVLSEFKKERPWTWQKQAERKIQAGKIVTYTDYYERIRLRRTFAVDWKRGVVYLLPDIDKPEIEWVDFDGEKKGRIQIDIHPERFEVDKDEMDRWRQNVLDNSESIIRERMEINSFIPDHAPALMGMAVVDDRLLVITGNRNWRAQENETLVFRLPDLHYEGSFYLAYPSFFQTTKFVGDYYILSNRQTDDEKTLVRVFRIERD
jgi:hypothetical protein